MKSAPTENKIHDIWSYTSNELAEKFQRSKLPQKQDPCGAIYLCHMSHFFVNIEFQFEENINNTSQGLDEQTLFYKQHNSETGWKEKIWIVVKSVISISDKCLDFNRILIVIEILFLDFIERPYVCTQQQSTWQHDKGDNIIQNCLNIFFAWNH